MPDPIRSLLATLGVAFNENPDYGMSPQSEYVKGALGAMQGQGEQPQLGADAALPLMLQLIDALANSKPDRPKPPAAPQPPQSVAGDMQQLNSPGAASANSPENQMLLQALLGR
jgi:hypothetical protein